MLKEWSPHGYDRAVELFERGYYDKSHFFRVVKKFLVQFGMSCYALTKCENDAELKHLAESTIADDPQLSPPIKFEEGVVSFAGSGPNSRTSHLFIAYGAIQSLGKELWETPIGRVIDGMDTVWNLYGEYGDMKPWGKGPQQHLIAQKGLKYLNEEYPNLSQFDHCSVKRVGAEVKDVDVKTGKDDDGNDHDEADATSKVEKVVPVASKAEDVKVKEISNVTNVFEHIAFPIGAACLVFLLMRCIMSKGKKQEGKTV